MASLSNALFREDAAPSGYGRLSRAWGDVRSYDHTGAQWSWQPPPALGYERAALDVEAKDSTECEYMACRFGLSAEQFLRRWTVSEAVAKALDVPILDYVDRYGLADDVAPGWTCRDGLWLCRLEHPTHWAAVAVLPGAR